MSRIPLVTLALLAATAAACSNPEKDRIKATTQATYDSKTGRLTRLTADLNKDGVIDSYTYMDGTKVLRSEIDADQDGRIEKWEFHNGALTSVMLDENYDGSPDRAFLVRSRVLWFSSPDANKLVLVGAGSLIMAVALVLTLSRSGIGAMALRTMTISSCSQKEAC